MKLQPDSPYPTAEQVQASIDAIGLQNLLDFLPGNVVEPRFEGGWYKLYVDGVPSISPGALDPFTALVEGIGLLVGVEQPVAVEVAE